MIYNGGGDDRGEGGRMKRGRNGLKKEEGIWVKMWRN